MTMRLSAPCPHAKKRSNLSPPKPRSSHLAAQQLPLLRSMQISSFPCSMHMRRSSVIWQTAENIRSQSRFPEGSISPAA